MGYDTSASPKPKITRKSKAVRCAAVLPEQKCVQATKSPQVILCVLPRALRRESRTRAPAGALPRLDERAAHSPQFRYCGARGDKRPAIKAGSALIAEGASHAAPEAERGGAGGREAKHIKPLQNAQGERRRDRFLIVRCAGLQGTHGSGTRGRLFLPRVPVRSVVVSEVFDYSLLD